MKKIMLTLDPILYYMEDSSEFAKEYFIDLIEQAVVSPDKSESVRREDLKDKERFLRITPLTSSEQYEIMQDFASTRESEAFKALLYGALEQKKPFWNFRNALKSEQGMENAFRMFKNGVLREILKKRLADIDYDLIDKKT